MPPQVFPHQARSGFDPVWAGVSQGGVQLVGAAERQGVGFMELRVCDSFQQGQLHETEGQVEGLRVLWSDQATLHVSSPISELCDPG